MLKLRSYKSRPMHLGPFPLEKLARQSTIDFTGLPDFTGLSFRRPEDPLSIVNAMQEYQAMLDATRDGLVKREVAEIPDDPVERSNHLKAFGYFSDASQVGIGPLPSSALLATPTRNPGIDRLRDDLKNRQTKTLASGIDLIMADLRDAM